MIRVTIRMGSRAVEMLTLPAAAKFPISVLDVSLSQPTFGTAKGLGIIAAAACAALGFSEDPA